MTKQLKNDKGIEYLPQNLISNHYIFATQNRIFQTVNSVWSNNLSFRLRRVCGKNSIPLSMKVLNEQ